MTLDEVMEELESFGNPQTVKIYRNHGANGEMFGVKIGDLKTILKRIKGDQELAMELWETGNSDAMYLAALVAKGDQMSVDQLNDWAASAWWYMLSEYSVPFVAAEHPEAFELAKTWMTSDEERIAAGGWATYSTTISVRADDELDLEEIRGLLQRVEDEIDDAANRVRHCMNHFVIAVGSFVKPLHKDAVAAAKRIGKVSVDMGNTACKVPLATDAIKKVKDRGTVGKKRKHTKC